MSKKNKAFKQLLKAQMQANATAASQGKDISNQFQAPVVSGVSGAVPSVGQQVVIDKQTAEFALIKKDIKLSSILIFTVIICLIAIYFVDRSHPFLLSLANQIFKVL